MGGMTKTAIAIAWSYIIGSVFFLGGSILFHPFFSVNDALYQFGVAQFIAGSALFLIPAIYEWWANFHALMLYEPTPTTKYRLPSPPSYTDVTTLALSSPSIKGNFHDSNFSPSPPSVRGSSFTDATYPASPASPSSTRGGGGGGGGGDEMPSPRELRPPHSPLPSPREVSSLVHEQASLHEHYHLEKHAVTMTRSTISVINGVLFVVGSVAYWPSFDRVGIVTGNWLFRMGSSFTLLSCIWAFSRLFKPTHHSKKMLIMLKIFFLQYIFGAGGFLIGGCFFLFRYAVIGSIIWSLGSVFFILGSLMLLKM